jgi:periplasmic protein TorT
MAINTHTVQHASLALLLSLALTSSVRAADTWSADVFDVVNGKFVPGTYTSISTKDITKPWRICVLYPHLKDDYWLGHDYGIVEEAKRDHVGVQVYEAGGYANLATQLNQFDNCVVQKFDAILIAAISADGVSAAVKKAVAQGIVVIDYPNGINEPSISGHARVPFYNMGHAAGDYIVKTEAKGTPVVAFLPGPEGAGFSDETVAGFKDAVANSTVKIAAMPRGDLSVNAQLDLVQAALQGDPSINYIVALNTGADASVVALRQAGHKKGEIPIFSIGVSPAVQNSLLKGEMKAAVTDFPVTTARIAIDLAVRLLEKKPPQQTNVGPRPAVIDKAKAEDGEFMKAVLAPKNFQPIFTVETK